MRPWILAECNYGDMKDRDVEVAVIPLGATEPHNYHLPYGTDLFEATIVGEKICEAAFGDGAKVVLLPTIPYGTQTNMRELPLAINVMPSTLFRFLTDIIESLLGSGVRKIVILNSHGGNEMKPLLRELSGENEAKLFLCNWYNALDDIYFDIFEKGEDHAGEMETSFALAYFDDLVARNEDGSLAADDGSKRSTRLEAVNKGWVSITRPWHLLTVSTGAADPHAASAEKGRRMMDAIVDRLGGFLKELSGLEIDDQFPF